MSLASDKDRRDPRLARINSPSLRNWGEPPSGPEGGVVGRNAILDCGWGRLVFAHTFRDVTEVAETLLDEQPGRRDIALYLRDPHVVLSQAPQSLFLDPSHTYRLWLSDFRAGRPRRSGFQVRRLRIRSDADAINQLYRQRRMVPVDPKFVWTHRATSPLTYLVAEDRKTSEIIGTATGVDHHAAFDDPEEGSSLWCLAVDHATPHSGVGLELVRQLAGHFQARGRVYMDLSVMHDNEAAIALYEKLGFRRVPVFCLKHKNALNEPLFMGPDPGKALNPYAIIIVDEARRRGIAVEVVDAEEGYFALTHGGRTIVCREALSELTSAIAMSRCDDKAVTRKVLARAGLSVPEQRLAGDGEADRAFLAEHGAVVAKPLRGEQGQGVSVNLRTPDALDSAVTEAHHHCDRVLLERYCAGEDLRIVVIDYEVVAAAVRRPPTVTGDGEHTVAELVEKQSRRRAEATGGESRIPLDAEARRCVAEAGFDLDDVLPAGRTLQVRKAANLHAGGTIHDVTARLHPTLREAAERAARALDIPVVGLDFLVPSVEGPEYVVIEANERPGLANHEPQPTAERFIDLLFPLTARRRRRRSRRPGAGAENGTNP